MYKITLINSENLYACYVPGIVLGLENIIEQNIPLKSLYSSEGGKVNKYVICQMMISAMEENEVE